MTGAPPRDHTLQGILAILVAVALFVVMDALIKWLSERYPTMQTVFFRSFIALIPITVLAWRAGGLRTMLIARAKGMHFLRCAFGLLSMVCFFHAVRYLPLAEIIAIGFAAPLFMTALSVPLLGEKVGLRRWSAVIVGFIGVLIMVRPGGDVFDAAAAVAIVGTVFYALTMVVMRRLSRTETTASITFYFAIAGSLVGAASLPFVWVDPTPVDWLLLILVGLIGGIAQIFMTQAFRLAPVAVIAPFDYTAMLWGSALGYAVWSEVPDVWVWVGAVVVAASGLYIVYRETHLRLPRPNIGTRTVGRR